MNCYKINQVVTTISGVPDVVTLFEQINTSSGMWYATIDQENAFFLHPCLQGPAEAVCFQLPRPAILPSFSYLRSTLILKSRP